MTSPWPTTGFLAQVAAHFAQIRPFMPMYAHIIISALFPIYTGAHASLSCPSSAEKPKKKPKRDDAADQSDDEDNVHKMEGMSNMDAVVLPVTAALVLASLYFLIAKYGADLINLVLGYYFSGIGVYSVTQLVNDALTVAFQLVFPAFYTDQGRLWRIVPERKKAVHENSNSKESTTRRASPLPGLFGRVPVPRSITGVLWTLRATLRQRYFARAYIATVVDMQSSFNLINVLSAIVGLGTIAYVNLVSKAWFLTNLQGFAVSYSAMQLMSPTSFATGSLILMALFCYDIWAVFFTPLMVTVAQNLDQPIKLVFPRPDEPNEIPGEPPIKGFSMLGLGDIVLPGIMIGLALRFDLFMFYLRKQKRTRRSSEASADQESIEKAPYVSIHGQWGSRIWTQGLPRSILPAQLQCSFPKHYFRAALIGYVAGMITTLGAMSAFQHAQPALLYLVPGVLGSLCITAVFRRELPEVWQFTEAVTGEQVEAQPATSISGRLWAEIWGTSQTEQANDKTPPKKEKQKSSSPSEKNGEDKPLSKSRKKGQQQTLISFSIRSGASKASMTEAHPRSHSQSTEHRRSSLSGSEDAIVVSAADVDGTVEQPQ